MKKNFMIMANQKYGVPLKSTCIIMNNNYVQNAKTISKDPNAEDKDEFYLTIDEKLDVIIYIVDIGAPYFSLCLSLCLSVSLSLFVSLCFSLSLSLCLSLCLSRSIYH